ncbi:type IV pilus inner membrane component PilO [Zobellella maritima]|uniref:type 4a pilus biogenesis protein PilO n=1 Tax=Zobellella maritima TaxID=2059725 RepID=UPI000E30707A|nr:type 4a pilus biogenesis protein PilO [Zobellella maritima]
MNWQNINELELDFDNIGQWPRAARIIAILIMCGLVSAGFSYLFISDSLKGLEQARAQEIKLKEVFEEKARLAVLLPEYEKQVAELEEQLTEQLKKLPNGLEVAGLLDDISFIATDNGLQLQRINWESEKPNDFTTELPMRIIVSGDYHQLGRFAADIAALPRIVVIDSFDVSRAGNERLNMSMLAKTYKYSKQEAP